jgi:hypothetical protein
LTKILTFPKNKFTIKNIGRGNRRRRRVTSSKRVETYARKKLKLEKKTFVRKKTFRDGDNETQLRFLFFGSTESLEKGISFNKIQVRSSGALRPCF